MKKYMDLCFGGAPTIHERKLMLAKQKDLLLSKIDEINNSVKYIDNKQGYYDGVLAGEIELTSNLVAI